MPTGRPAGRRALEVSVSECRGGVYADGRQSLVCGGAGADWFPGCDIPVGTGQRGILSAPYEEPNTLRRD